MRRICKEMGEPRRGVERRSALGYAGPRRALSRTGLGSGDGSLIDVLVRSHAALVAVSCRPTASSCILFFDIPIYPDSSKTREKFLVFFGLADSARRMIRGGFLTEEDRGKLIALVRNGSAASRVTRACRRVALRSNGPDDGCAYSGRPACRMASMTEPDQ
jgi:hypothetical protein